ncbi:hypothetical protein EPA93_05785 [Ktedonosporobacter rubrisoli]|uniref:Secreted protein n=1 Tax=Ktedonosporobacter rubrisoli TaxID=2509675 RepID=A0A4P6JKM8_KTERU|nr:hypothetical protein [Ktedonosporobacter rubrisoli]QBD75540.1 hypothetical protein EPA93_05785 [Ktedonosporobacter rubrisoli]
MRKTIPIALLCAVLACVCTFFLSAPKTFAAAADGSASSSLQVSSVSNNVHDDRPPYVRGYRQGYNDAVYDCTHTANRAQTLKRDDYSRGYVDGYNYARAHDRACTNPYTRGWYQGYHDAVYDCIHNAYRAEAKKLDDYSRGYVDGYNYARAHDRACTQH